MNIPSSVSSISLLCGTNNLCPHSPATISSTLTEILFLLRQKCPTAHIRFSFIHIHLFPILPRFDHLQTDVAATNSCIHFQVQELFPEFVFFHELPSTLFNQNLYRPDKLHLTKKGNDILVRWFHHSLTTSTSTKPEQNTPPYPPCKMFAPFSSSQILIDLPHLPHHNPSAQLYPDPRSALTNSALAITVQNLPLASQS